MGYWVGVPSRAAEGGERLLRPPRSPATAAPVHQERRTAANLTGADIEILPSCRPLSQRRTAGCGGWKVPRALAISLCFVEITKCPTEQQLATR